LLGNCPRRPALAVQRPDVFLSSEPPRPALRRPRLFLMRRHAWRHRDRGLAIGLDDGGTAKRSAHGFERIPVGAEHLIQRFGEVLHQVKAVGHLGGLRCARTGAVALRFHPIAGDDANPHMRP
jgi:hypothetical protein